MTLLDEFQRLCPPDREPAGVTLHQREAVGAVVRCGAALAGLVRQLDSTDTRPPALRALRRLTTAAFDPAATTTRAVLHRLGARDAVRSLFSPSRRAHARWA
jgi:hypothetical protein